MHNNIKKV